jgi:osmoprotectant transport system permease protein
VIGEVARWLGTSAHWHGADGVGRHVAEHLEYSLIALVIAIAVALPVGLLIGHTGRGTFVIVFSANGLRALPTIGVLVFFVILISPHIHGRGEAPYLIPTEIALVLIAIPPVLSGAYAGVQAVPPDTRDAAEGMGMVGGQVLVQVELPCALPLIVSGIRSATLQVIATATIGAYVSLGGLGRYIFDGLSQHDYPQMAAGALLVALLALAADLTLALVQRLVVSPGVSGRYSHKAAVSLQVSGAGPEPVAASAREAL